VVCRGVGGIGRPLRTILWGEQGTRERQTAWSTQFSGYYPKSIWWSKYV
jgi:hypothetical protein